jgi:hypothetical protein
MISVGGRLFHGVRPRCSGHREFHCAQKSVTLEPKRNLEERLRRCQQILRRYQHEVGSIGGICELRDLGDAGLIDASLNDALDYS